MQNFNFSEARQNLSTLLKLALKGEIQIRRRDGALFSLTAKKKKQSSPFDIPRIKTQATTRDILDAVRESRRG